MTAIGARRDIEGPFLRALAGRSHVFARALCAAAVKRRQNRWTSPRVLVLKMKLSVIALRNQLAALIVSLRRGTIHAPGRSDDRRKNVMHALQLCLNVMVLSEVRR